MLPYTPVYHTLLLAASCLVSYTYKILLFLIRCTISLTISMTSKSVGLGATKRLYFFYLSLYPQTTYVHSHPLYRQSPSESIGFLTQPIENTKLTTNFRGRACPKSLCIKDLRLVDHQLKEKAAAGFPATVLPFSP